MQSVNTRWGAPVHALLKNMDEACLFELHSAHMVAYTMQIGLTGRPVLVLNNQHQVCLDSPCTCRRSPGVDRRVLMSVVLPKPLSPTTRTCEMKTPHAC